LKKILISAHVVPVGFVDFESGAILGLTKAC
jgi:hypothetical protein